MFKKTIIFSVFIFFVQVASAQNGALKINIQKMGKTDSEIILNFVPEKTLKKGFSVQLPDGMPAAILSIRTNSKLLWLKESNENPERPNEVHWQKIQKGYVFRMLPNNLIAGTQIEIILQSPVKKDQEENHRIALLEIRVLEDGSIATVSEITGNMIPKLQDN